MDTIFGMPTAAIFGQLMLGVVNGAFYAILSLGLAIIFGILNIVNFAQGAFYMMGALLAWVLLTYVGIGYFPAIVIVPLLVGLFGIVFERTLLSRIYKLDHIYGLLLTFGMALVIEGLFHRLLGSSGYPYPAPALLQGGLNLGFMFLPLYRAWVIGAALILCLAVWYLVERTSLGVTLRAATENATLTEAFGINVPRIITLTFGLGVGLAGLAGVFAAPLYQVNTQMGSNVIIVVFAVVVIGGMGSVLGAIVSAFLLGIAEGMTKVFWPEASNTIVFVLMALVLLVRPAGIFGRRLELSVAAVSNLAPNRPSKWIRFEYAFVALLIVTLAAPHMIYPILLMKILCYALFACAFNLLLGFGGLMSFGHAAFFGAAAYATAELVKIWGLPTELGIVAGVVVATALGTLFGWLAIRRQGLYFAMVTLALAQMVYFFALQAPFTGSENGIQGVPRGTLLGIVDLNDTMSMYYFVLGVFLIGFLIIYRTVNSPFGQILEAIRDNEARVVSLGYQPNRYKLIAFIISAALSGLAGSTKALVLQLATLSDVHFMTSGDVVLMSLIGGLGTIFGPVFGAATIVTMGYYLSSLGSWVMIVQGAVFILCVLIFRRGIVGTLQRAFEGRVRANVSWRSDTQAAPPVSNAEPGRAGT